VEPAEARQHRVEGSRERGFSSLEKVSHRIYSVAGDLPEASSKDGEAGLYREARRACRDSSRYAPPGLLEESGAARSAGCFPTRHAEAKNRLSVAPSETARSRSAEPRRTRAVRPGATLGSRGLLEESGELSSVGALLAAPVSMLGRGKPRPYNRSCRQPGAASRTAGGGCATKPKE